MKLHFGDEQFEVDAAQLPVAFAQVTLGGGGIKRHTINNRQLTRSAVEACLLAGRRSGSRGVHVVRPSVNP